MSCGRSTLPWLLLAAVAASLGCGRRQEPPRPTFGSLGGEVAHVGDTGLPASLVARVARAQSETPRAALDALVDDALAARGARALGLDRRPDVAWATTAALARALNERLLEQARAEGPPRDDELADVTVVHAIVMRSRWLPEPNAVAIAQAIEHAVAAARDERQFEARAGAVPHPRAIVRVEHLPPFDASGHAADGTDVDPTFVAAAFALRSPGDTSPVTETPFGWHVIRLVARTPPASDVGEQRRRDLADAVFAVRVRARAQELLTMARQRERIEIAGPADSLMAEVVRAP